MKQADHVRLKKSTRKIVVESPSDAKFLNAIRGMIGDLSAKVGFPQGEVDKIVMAVDEACTNIVEHAYAPGKEWIFRQRDPEIRLNVRFEDDKLVVEINDHGQRFDFASYQPETIEMGIKLGRRRGFGINIIREFMDEVCFKSDDQSGNTLRLVKHLKKT